MKELFQDPNNLIEDLLATMRVYPQSAAVIELPSGTPEKAKRGPKKQKLPAPVEFIKLEKNLASLGFFSSSTKRIKSKKAKTVSITKKIDGRKIKATAKIVPSAVYGLPILSDQDRWFAFLAILERRRRKQGKLTNPITFSSGELLEILGQTDSGTNYEDITSWLDVMMTTTIISDGAVYLAGKKTWVAHRKRWFRVFQEAFSKGDRLADGTVLDQHYVIVSDWQLQNLNEHHVFSFDFAKYRTLEKHIAKALLPLLKTWLFASRRDGYFEKRYDDFCETLGLTEYRRRSKVKEKLGPAMEEMKQLGEISGWKVENTTDRSAFKIVFYHGSNYKAGRKEKPRTAVAPRAATLAYSLPPGEAGSHAVDRTQLKKLIERGITEHEAGKLLSKAPPGQRIDDQIDYYDHVSSKSPGKYGVALLYSFISDNRVPPETFETTRQRQDRQAREEEQKRQQDQEARLRIQYRQDSEQLLDQYIAANPQEFREEVEAETARSLEALQSYKKMSADLKHRNAATSATGKIRSAIAERICPSFEQWQRGQPAPVSAAELSQPKPPGKTGPQKPLNASADLSGGQTTGE